MKARVVVALSGPCSACRRYDAPLYRNPLGPRPVCLRCLEEREVFAGDSLCKCPKDVVLGDCLVHGFEVP